MIEFTQLGLDHKFSNIFTLNGIWFLLKSLFCLPGNLIIDFMASRSSLTSFIQWSSDPETMFNGWAAACVSFVVWVLIAALISGVNK